MAQAIADKILKISKYSQVLCITHLPQSGGGSGLSILHCKEVVGGRTQTSVAELAAAERENEIARMLAGSEITPLTIDTPKRVVTFGEKINKNKNHPLPTLARVILFCYRNRGKNS